MSLYLERKDRRVMFSACNDSNVNGVKNGMMKNFS